MSTREEMALDLMALMPEDTRDLATARRGFDAVTVFLDKYAPALVNDARWQALCEVAATRDLIIEVKDMFGNSDRATIASTPAEMEQQIDAWIARKAQKPEEG